MAPTVIANIQSQLDALTATLPELTDQQSWPDLIHNLEHLFQTIRQQTSLLEIGHSLADLAGSRPHPDEMLQQLVTLIQHKLGYHYVAALMIEPESEWIALKTDTAGARPAYRLKIEDVPAISRVVRQQRPDRVTAEESGLTFTQASPSPPSGQLSTLLLPLISREETIGLLVIQQSGETEPQALLPLASQMATTIENSRLLHQAENSRRFLKTVLEHIPNPIFIKDQKHTWIEMNQANANVIGQPAQELVGKTDADFFSAELTGEFYRRDDQVFTTNQIYEHEDTTIWSDNQPHTAYTRLIPIPDPSGQPEYIMGITHDVTERKMHEAERERFLAEMSALYEGSRAVASALSIRQVFAALFEQIKIETPSEISGYLYNTVKDEPIWAVLEANWQIEPNQTQTPGHKVYLPDTPLARLLTLDAPLFIENVTTTSRLSEAEQQALLERGVHSLAILSLAATGQKLGVVMVHFREPYSFSTVTQRFWAALIDQAGVALSNRKMLQEGAYRAIQLETAAEVARAASLLDLNALLNAAVALIRDRFHLYYVGIFLVDTTQTWAILRAGTGQAGRIQLTKNHRLKVGSESMIGWCVEHRRPRIALDVGQDAVHFANPALPDTRSEMALPLIYQNEVTGALTVQSIEPAAFSRGDVIFLQTMADQLANAIENARLFENVARAQSEAEIRLQETMALQKLSQLLSGTLQADEILDIFFAACITEIELEYVMLSLVDSYQNRVRAIAGRGIADSNIKRANHSLDSGDIMADIVRSGKTEIITGWDDRFDKETFEAEGHAHWVRIFTPITLRLEHIGLVEAGFNKTTRSHITDYQVRQLQAFISQTALALDNAKRYEASQRRARREALIKEITTKVRASTDLDTILQTTVKEVGEAIASKRAYIRLGPPANSESVSE